MSRETHDELQSSINHLSVYVFRLEAIAESARAWRQFLIDKYGDEDWKCPYVAKLMIALKELDGYAPLTITG